MTSPRWFIANIILLKNVKVNWILSEYVTEAWSECGTKYAYDKISLIIILVISVIIKKSPEFKTSYHITAACVVDLVSYFRVLVNIPLTRHEATSSCHCAVVTWCDRQCAHEAVYYCNEGCWTVTFTVPPKNIETHKDYIFIVFN